MGGQHGIRGYLLQAIVTVLESLSKKAEWKNVTLEPSDESEKVDVLWEYNDGTKKVVQIKSSQNTINYSAANSWAEELKEQTSADCFELICIGHVDTKLNKAKDINGVKITVKPLDFESLQNNSIVKLDEFYERSGRSKISSTIKEVLLNSLNYKLSKESIFGKTISAEEFDTILLTWLSEIESHVSKNPFIKFMPFEDGQAELSLNQKITTNFLKLIGWSNYTDNHIITFYDQKTLSDKIATVDYYIAQESKLKDNTTDHIFFNSIQDFKYPETTKTEILNFLTSTNQVTEEFKRNRKISPTNNNNIFNILFWISTENTDLNMDFADVNRDYFRNERLQLDQQYYFVDNARANFIISSIATAKNYRPEQVVKFIYPITESNLSYNKIGKRGIQLPPEYINTNILPIIKEGDGKISVLLFCADAYEYESLKKIIWLLIVLTSGMANEYIIYFPDFDDRYKGEVIEAVNSFENADLIGKIKVYKSLQVDTQNISQMDIDVAKDLASDVKAIEENKEIRINPIFREQLPYGDLLKPILNTDRVSAQDLKIFLSLRGIFVKNADKKQLIDLMSNLLFSPLELINFINLINVKEKPVTSTPIIITLNSNDSVKTLFNSIKPDFSRITEGLQAKLDNSVEFNEDPSVPDMFVYTAYVEKKDITKHVAINTTWEPIKISYKKIDDHIVVNTVETNSRDGKVIARRIVESIKAELIEKNHIKEDTVQLTFNDFSSNRERVNFLLSFINIDHANLFIDQDIKGLKFIFDETQEIPDLYKDKTEKDLIILFRGKNLVGLREISEDNFKDVILLEEISITYKFEVKGIVGFYNVKYNFSEALKFKPIQGDFRSQSYLHTNHRIKQLRNISTLEKQLTQEVESLKVEKLRKFGKI
ncbi:hypothetical protein [Sphingobacterium sp. UDSM-2020]|uniref:hypothetical protein n=1 Tax=Sphingobacterium sp. UDSM-2020 TaxID=2795738 RepID=UPI001935999A|nr:hypothetical protein [Sphingobacterium sp. UDSM-2020]QQD13143.1 hypothetical protein JAZ75_21515 [Sphingobacterium sp. UDSM-2020]